MPTYKTLTIPTALYPGDIGLSFNAEAPDVSVTPVAGERFALGAQDNALMTVTLDAQWSAAPTAAVVDLQIADVDAEASYVTVDSVTFAGTEVTLRLDVAGVGAYFARARLASHTDAAGETLTVRIIRR